MHNPDANSPADPDTSTDIAIIGLACRFPGARDATEFWANLAAGRESIRDVSDEEYLAAGGDPAALSDPYLVRVESDFPDMDCFDARFFGYSSAEAELLDPQQRMFLECGYHALEDAGYHATRYPGVIGVYAGANESHYYLDNLYPWLAGASASVASLTVRMANAPGMLSTRLSYQLGLQGPSVYVQTTCSTSLVAVHLACQELLNYSADMALAGGVALNPALRRGYRYVPDGPYSPDGRCRAFSADAAGISAGNGVGLVVLKRLVDALADRDHIRAVIKATAINNDGDRKVGVTAPSVRGQAEVIVAAHELAQVRAGDITYLEAHGTGTKIGDPIEVAALTEAFGRSTDRRQFCALGSVKTNIGHLDAAAGVASLIKTVLALEHRTIPPSLNFDRPNPLIDFASSPFWVVTTATPWRSDDGPRRAGVSSFGFGGTNAHAIVQEAPSPPIAQRSPAWSILPLAARTPVALGTMTSELGGYLRAHPELDIVDVAHTLQCRSGPFPHRSTTVCRSTDEAAEILINGGSDTGCLDGEQRPVAFLFPGAGAHYNRMGENLYHGEPVYRAVIDRSAEILAPVLGYDLRSVLYTEQDTPPDDATLLDGDGTTRRSAAYPAVVATEYALATLLLARGVRPAGLLGHSLGEYAAACLAGVFSLEDVLPLVAERERLIASVGGLTLSVQLDAQQCTVRYLSGRLSLAAINAPTSCAVSGPADEIVQLELRLAADGVLHQRLRTPGAVHSVLLDPVLDELATAVGKVDLREPRLPFVSGLTGTWITKEQATDPTYWVRHSRLTVQFAEGLTQLYAAARPVLLEAGPSHGLAKLTQLQLGPDTIALPVMRHGYAPDDDQQFFYRAIARLWTQGVAVEWASVTEQARWRVPLPGYPFERERFWVDGPAVRPRRNDPAEPLPRFLDQPRGATPADVSPAADPARDSAASSAPQSVGTELLYGVSWRRCVDVLRPDPALVVARRWIILSDRSALAQELTEALSHHGAEPIVVVPGTEFRRVDAVSFLLTPERKEDYKLLLDAVGRAGTPLCIVDFWASLATAAGGLDLASAVGIAHGASRGAEDIELSVVTCGAFDITGGERLIPRSACAVAASRTLALELPQISTKILDLDPVEAEGAARTQLVRRMLADLTHRGGADLVGHRLGHRWLQQFEPLAAGNVSEPLLRQGGVYVLTGGLGGVGLCVAEYLAREYRARLVLLGRSASEEQIPVRLRGLGGEVLVRRADVADRSRIKEILQETQQRFGAIHGIVHAAGVPGGGMLPLLSLADIARALQAKVVGTCVLFDSLREIGAAPDFVVLFSSVVALSGVPGLACYAAANAFLDAFAGHASRNLDVPALSINWDGWRGLGMAADEQALADMLVVTEGMDVDAAVAAFRSALAVVPLGQVIASTLPPGLLIRAISTATAPAVTVIDAGTASPAVDSVVSDTSLARDVVAIWEETLGVADVGLHDNFIELGGDSMLALQIVQRCKDRLNRTVSVRQLFTTRTVAGLVQALVSTAGQERVAELPNPEKAAQDSAPASFPGLDSVRLDRLSASWTAHRTRGR
ncbi:MAG: SDR family NAD(P)-dependent oxidoreductase [Pseudonocardiaceae bacterium]